jgi:surfeit locus 1 family protein
MRSGDGRGGLLVPAILVIAGLAVLLGLGTWQVERKAWKEALIETLKRRASAAPVELPSASEWQRLNAADSEFTRVRLRAEFGRRDDALVFTSGSPLRDDAKAGGYFVFTPARLPNGQQVVVNRGYAPGRSYPATAGVQEIVGALRWPEQPSWFASAHDAAGEIWTVRDPVVMAAAKRWGPVAPFYIEQEAPVPPGGTPHPAPLQVNLRNEHLQYAITWYGLAAVLVTVFGFWLQKRRREGRP